MTLPDSNSSRQLDKGPSQKTPSFKKQCVREWLVNNGKTQWPDAVLSFNGIAGMPPFESDRDNLKLFAADPLG